MGPIKNNRQPAFKVDSVFTLYSQHTITRKCRNDVDVVYKYYKQSSNGICLELRRDLACGDAYDILYFLEARGDDCFDLYTAFIVEEITGTYVLPM